MSIEEHEHMDLESIADDLSVLHPQLLQFQFLIFLHQQLPGWTTHSAQKNQRF